MLKSILQGGFDLWLNSIVAHIPCWTVRKMFYKLAGMKIGKGARIGMRTRVSKPRQITIGERSVINPDCYLDGRGVLVIEQDVSISRYSKIITESHKKDSGNFDTYVKSVVIKHHAWLGMSAMVLPGSTVGERAILGAGCVFKGECENDNIMVGNPAKCIGKRNLEEEYQKDFKAYFV